jgi:FkbM family methyltransferase
MQAVASASVVDGQRRMKGKTLVDALGASPLAPAARYLAKRMPASWWRYLPPSIVNRTWSSGCVWIELPPGGRILMVRENASHDLAVYGYATKGGEALRLFAACLPHAQAFLDIGANTGVFSLLAARAGVARVHAFEPAPAIFDLLVRNVRLNCLRNVECHPIAVSDRLGSAVLYIPPGQVPTEASTQRGFRRNTQEVVVETTTLDDFARLHDVGPVDLMKIDTESTEPQVLAGARQLLGSSRPVMICEVLKGLTEARLHALLSPYAYRYFWLTDRGLVPRERIQGDADYRFLNYVFVTREREDAVHEAAARAFSVH